MSKFGKETVVAVLETRMSDIRQRKEVREVIGRLPQRLEDSQLISFKGSVVGTWEGEDQEIVPQSVYDDQKVITDAWITKIFTPINNFLGSASEREEEDEEPIESEAIGRDPDEDDGEDEDAEILQGIEALIKKGKAKKAKKELKGLKEIISDEQYQAFKQQIKEL